MNFKTRDLIMASFFLALGLILPYCFHLVGMAGIVFLPMHIPVLLCGFILGPRYGFIIGLITPLLNTIFTGIPPIYPTAIAMACELGTYGFIAGYLYKKKNLHVVLSLISAMLLGRIVLGTMNYLLITLGGNEFVLKMFITVAFVKSIWGIILQLALIPIITIALEKNARMVNTYGK